MSFCHYHRILHKDIELLNMTQKTNIEKFLTTSEILLRVSRRSLDPLRCRLPFLALHLDYHLCSSDVHEDIEIDYSYLATRAIDRFVGDSGSRSGAAAA